MNIINGVETDHISLPLRVRFIYYVSAGRLGVGVGGDETERNGGRTVKQLSISVGGVYGIGLGQQILLKLLFRKKKENAQTSLIGSIIRRACTFFVSGGKR